MDKRKRIPVKDVKQIALEIGLWAIDIEKINTLEKRLGKPSSETFKEKFDNHIDARIQMAVDKLDYVSIVDEIAQLEVDDYWKYPKELSPDSINEKLQELGISEDITADWNGCDLDWSIIDPFLLGDKEYEIWGCATSGSFMFRRNK